MKNNLITLLIVLVIFALAFIFGTALIESKAQAYHAVSGFSKHNTAGNVFLTVVLFCLAGFSSYMTVLVRHDF